MILAAGLGLRMRPLTKDCPKPCLPLLNRPLILWTLETLARNGIKDVVVNTHYLPGQVREALAASKSMGMRVVFSHERRILGTGGGPRRVRAFFGGEPALIVNGDVLFDFDLKSLESRHRHSGAAATLALKSNPDPSIYGPIVTGRHGRILSLAGRPRAREGPVSLFTGVHILDAALLERLPTGPSDSVRDLYAPLVAEGGRLLGVRVRGAWYDLGTPALYLKTQMALLKVRGRSAVDREASVDSRALVSRSTIGAGCVIGPQASVEDSVLLPGASVAPGAKVGRSILGRGVHVAEGRTVTGKVGVSGKEGPLWSRL